MRASIAAVGISMGLLLAGCGAVVDGANLYTSSTNRGGLNQLAVGMTKEEVIAIMGTPHKREAIGRHEFLLYRTETYGDGDRSFTPVVIVDGRLTGWGRNFYDDVRRADLTIRQR
jgi:hypothetical protein